MRFDRLVLTLFSFLLVQGLWAQDDVVSPTPVFSKKKISASENDPDFQMMKMEMEKYRLQNEKLKLEINGLKLQKGLGSPVNLTPQSDKSKKEEGKINLEASARAEQQAKENSDNPKMIIFDTQNGELWIEAVRYPVYEIYHVMQNKKWKMKRTLITTQANGMRRFKYSFRNISLEKYENKKYGIFVMAERKNDEDFQIQTIEGVGFGVPEGEARNRFQNENFRFDGEGRSKNIFYLRYKRTHGFFGWDDKLAFGFDARTEKMVEVKYGVLDEN
jgi:hypothetical protein